MTNHSYKQSRVEIEGTNIVLDMIHDKDPETHFLPMTAPPRYFIEWAKSHPDETDAEALIADMERMIEAGVPSLPLYESKASEAGLKWRVVA